MVSASSSTTTTTDGAVVEKASALGTVTALPALQEKAAKRFRTDAGLFYALKGLREEQAELKLRLATRFARAEPLREWQRLEEDRRSAVWNKARGALADRAHARFGETAGAPLGMLRCAVPELDDEDLWKRFGGADLFELLEAALRGQENADKWLGAPRCAQAMERYLHGLAKMDPERHEGEVSVRRDINRCMLLQYRSLWLLAAAEEVLDGVLGAPPPALAAPQDKLDPTKSDNEPFFKELEAAKA